MLLTILSGLLISCQPKHVEVDYFANNGFGNPITGNAGEYYKGVTYMAYQGPLEDPYVAAYNHETEEWSGPFKAGTSLMGKDPSRKIDNHGKPTLIVDGEGFIHLVFGGHGGTPDLGENPLGNYHYGKQTHVVTTKPMDISNWEVLDNITPFGTYSQFLKMDNGDIYLFYRHGAHRSNWVYQISKDNCRTFSPLISIVKTKQIEGTEENPNIWDSWYLNFKHGEGNDIIVAYNYHLCKGPRHDGERHNCYYMKFDTDNNEWLNVKGEKLQLPITKEYADEKTLVKNTGEKWTHNGMACLDNLGLPFLTSYEGEHDGLVHGGPKQVILYNWTGNEWLSSNTGLPVGAKGIIQVDDPKEVTFLLAYKENKLAELASWKSDDGGHNFMKEAVFIAEKESDFLLSHTIRNAHPNAQFIAARKIKGSDYAGMYLFGDKGAIKRKRIDADIIK